MASPEDRLTAIEQELARLDAWADDHEIVMIGVGPLEDLLGRGGEDLLWPRIEALARSDLKFRRALASCWAYSSPRYEDRYRLLDELGEFYGARRRRTPRSDV